MKNNDNFLFVVLFIAILFPAIFCHNNSTNKISELGKGTVDGKSEKGNILSDYVWPDGKRRIIHEGDVQKVNFEIHLAHDGYVGTGPATEIIKLNDSFRYLDKHRIGNNGLINNVGLNEHYIQFSSVFGEKYDCYIFTRRMLDTVIIKKDNWGWPYLAKVEWGNNENLLVTIKQTTRYQLRELDESLFL